MLYKKWNEAYQSLLTQSSLDQGVLDKVHHFHEMLTSGTFVFIGRAELTLILRQLDKDRGQGQPIGEELRANVDALNSAIFPQGIMES